MQKAVASDVVKDTDKDVTNWIWYHSILLLVLYFTESVDYPALCEP